MSLVIYPAVITEGETPSVSLGFPDFVDLNLVADSPTDLLLAARQRLGLRLKELEKAGEPWPTASTLTQIHAAHRGDGVSIVWIDVIVEDTPIRVTISLGERLLAQVDAAAEAYGLTRSGFLAACARRQIVSGVSPLTGDAGQRLYEDVAAAGRKIQEVLGPDSPVGRTLAEMDSVALDGLRRIAGGVSTAIRGYKKPRANTGKADAAAE